MNFRFVTEIIIVILCIINAVTDLKSGLIKNKYLLLCGTVAIVFNFVSIRLDLVDTINPSYYLYVVMGIALSVLLYATKIWAGGDCKFIIILCLALPYHLVIREINGIPTIILIMTFAFILGYFFLIGDSLIQYVKTKKSEGEIIKKSFVQFIDYIKVYFAVVFLQSVLYTAVKIMNLHINQWIYMIINILLIYLIIRTRILEDYVIVILLVLADILLGFWHISEWISIRTLQIWLLIIVLGIFRNFTKQYNYQSIDVNELQKGMILSVGSSFVLCSDKNCKFANLSDESLASRLSEEDVNQIKEYAGKKKNNLTISIVKKIPFAIFISISTLVVLCIGEIL